MDNKNEHKGPKEAVWEHLKANARQLSSAYDLSDFCRENGIDERDAWEYLSTVEIDDEYKDKIRRRCEWKAKTHIRASDIYADGPGPGMAIDQVRGLFQVITSIAEDVRGVHVGKLRPGTVIHLQDRGIRPELVNEISEVMSRLCRYIKHRIPWEMQGYVPAPDDPSSIMAPISPDDHIETWIRDNDPGVYLETRPGQYEWAMCAVIFDETASLSRTRAIEIPQVPASEAVMDGIAKAFEKWYDTDDATLTYIIRHHCLPDGHNKVSYRGPAPDAVRFWKTVHMTPGEWNGCFMPDGGRGPIKSNALGVGLDIDKYKVRGIYIPLREFGLLGVK